MVAMARGFSRVVLCAFTARAHGETLMVILARGREASLREGMVGL